jgi:hypothetical protein
MSVRQYKFARLLNDGRVVSEHDMETEWRISVTNEVAPPTEECVGLNSSRYIQDARRYVVGEVLLYVECSGARVRGRDKDTWQRQTPLKMWRVPDEYDKATAAARAECNKAIAAARAGYDKATAAARAECEKATAPARVEYDKATAPALAEYDKATARAQAECDKATAPAWAEYEKAAARALAEYDKATARARAAYNKAAAPARVEYDKATVPARARYHRALRRLICRPENEVRP